MERRKLVFIVVEEGLRPDILEVLKDQGIEHYTLWAGAEGAGETGPKQGSPIWPGLNDVVLVAVDESKVQPLIDESLKVRDSFEAKLGLRFMITDCQFV